MTAPLAFCLSVARKAGELVASGTADSGSAASLVDDALIFSRAEQLQGKEITIYAGTDIGDSRFISTFTPGTDTIVPAGNFSGAIDNTSYYYILDTLTTARLRELIAAAIKDLGIEKVKADETTVLTNEQVEYAVPSGFTNISNICPETDDIVLADCESTWSYASHGTGHDTGAGTAMTQAVETSNYRVGAGALKVTIPNGATINVSFIENLDGVVDLSGRTVIRGWVYKPTAVTITGNFALRLSPTASNVTTTVSTENITYSGTITSDTWSPVYWTLANPYRDNLTTCIGITTTAYSASGDSYLLLDHIRAVGNFNEDLDTDYWRIQNNYIQFNPNYSPTTDARLRIVGRQKVTFPTDNTTAVDTLVEDHIDYIADYVEYQKLREMDWTGKPELVNKAQLLAANLRDYRNRNVSVSRLPVDGRKVY